MTEAQPPKGPAAALQNKFGRDTGGFWVRRWIQLQDGTSCKPFHLQLYKVAEGMTDLDIRPGVIVVCTHVRVVCNSEHIRSSHDPRSFHLTSTAESQISILNDDLKEQLKDEEIISNLEQWSHTQDCQHAMSQALVGGYLACPTLPGTLDGLKSFFKEWQILPSTDWERMVESLRFRECRQLLVQATAVHVSLTLIQDNHSSNASPSKKPRQDVKEDSLEVTLDFATYNASDAMVTLGSRCLEDSSFPSVYTADRWREQKCRLAFPDTVYMGENNQISSQDTEYTNNHYFTITWTGLNTKVLLQTHFLPPANCFPGSTLSNLLKGNMNTESRSARSISGLHDKTNTELQQSIAASILSGKQTLSTAISEGPNPEALRKVLLTASECSDKRYLLVLDCFKERDYAEIMLNRAFEL